MPGRRKIRVLDEGGLDKPEKVCDIAIETQYQYSLGVDWVSGLFLEGTSYGTVKPVGGDRGIENDNRYNMRTRRPSDPGSRGCGPRHTA